MSSPNKSSTPEKSNTGTIIFIFIVAIIALAALILSIIPFFQKSSTEGEGECPKKGCDIEAKNFSATNISVTNVKNKLLFEQGFTSNGTVSFPSAEYDDLEATEISGTKINYTNATFSNISNTNITATNARFLKTINQSGIYYNNNSSTSVGLRNITLTNTNTFYSIELGSVSNTNINLLLDGTKFSTGQSIILNCWSRPNTAFPQTVINLSNVNTTYKLLDTVVSGTYVSNTQLLIRNTTKVRSRNYYIHYFANTFHLIRIGSSDSDLNDSDLNEP